MRILLQQNLQQILIVMGRERISAHNSCHVNIHKACTVSRNFRMLDWMIDWFIYSSIAIKHFKATNSTYVCFSEVNFFFLFQQPTGRDSWVPLSCCTLCPWWTSMLLPWWISVSRCRSDLRRWWSAMCWRLPFKTAWLTVIPIVPKKENPYL